MPSANIDALFPYSPFISQGKIVAATTDKSGATTTNIVQMYTAGLYGDKISWIKFKHTGTSTSGTFLIWITDTTGINPSLVFEQAFSGGASSTTITTVEYTFSLDDFQMAPNQKLWVGCTSAGSAIDVTAQVGKYYKP